MARDDIRIMMMMDKPKRREKENE